MAFERERTDFIELLRQRGMRVTRERLAVLDEVFSQHAHLDACYACYRYKLGFVVEDAALVCIACRLEYRLEDEVWDYIGACAPISIHSSIEGDALVIDEAVLDRAARYF